MTPNPTTKGMSEAEVLADLASIIDRLQEESRDVVATRLESIRSTIESTFADRTALLEVVRRLLPYAQGHADPDNPGSVALAAEARALLSRITAPEASR